MKTIQRTDERLIASDIFDTERGARLPRSSEKLLEPVPHVARYPIALCTITHRISRADSDNLPLLKNWGRCHFPLTTLRPR
jgi:hypothetical protein